MKDWGGMPIEVSSPRLILRPVGAADVTEEYVSGLNDPVVHEYLVSVKQMRQTMETVIAYVRANLEDPRAILFGMFLQATQRLIGTVRLHSVERVHGTGTIGVCVFLRDYWGQGYSTEAISAVSDWALRKVAVRYLEASCYQANTASLRAFLKAGYEVAGRLENKYLLNGRPHPVIYLKRMRAAEEPT